jgi:hypothetical protein
VWRGRSEATVAGELAPVTIHNGEGMGTTNMVRTTNATAPARNPLGLMAIVHTPGKAGLGPVRPPDSTPNPSQVRTTTAYASHLAPSVR